ncbi:MAG: hypothetical protein ACSLEM_06700 [Candidatus Malihini olakiniferum]
MSNDPAKAKLFKTENFAASKESTKHQDAFANILALSEHQRTAIGELEGYQHSRIKWLLLPFSYQG